MVRQYHLGPLPVGSIRMVTPKIAGKFVVSKHLTRDIYKKSGRPPEDERPFRNFVMTVSRRDRDPLASADGARHQHPSPTSRHEF